MKRLLVNALLLILSTTICLIVLEQGYRVYLFGGASFSVEKVDSVSGIGVSGLIKPSNNSEIIYELKPNLDTYFKLVEFRTNSHGLRDQEYSYSKPENTIRVAVIGDSFTMPAGVAIEDAFHSLLEERFTKRSQQTTYQFINFGVGGYNLRQYLATLKSRASAYDPDLIIIGFCPANDHEVPLESIFSQPYQVKPKVSPFYKSFVLSKIRSLTKARQDKESRPIFDAEQQSYINATLSEMSAYGVRRNVPVVITYLSHQFDQTYANALEKLALDNGLLFANVSAPFAGVDVRDYKIYPTDSHPNKEAHRLFANELFTYLSPLLQQGDQAIETEQSGQ
ncbi:MAG: hypothetical protein DHS20C11_28730 [Lysobacteraceae bacterium]|nr:MAG: hypothetical protein DHS20C11_28730 [Xanthomonadaceae bacterium]